MAEDGDNRIDRRDALRRRIYLACLVVGIPSLCSVWFVQRTDDPFIAVAYPLYALSQVWVLVGLWRWRMDVRTAERVVLLGTVLTFLGGLAVGVAAVSDLAGLREELNVSTLLTINLMAMLAYVAFETTAALRLSLGVVAAFVAILAFRLVPEVAATGVSSDVTDYLAVTMFLLTSVGLLHVMAQVKSQAAEASVTAAAMEALANTDALTGLANRRQLHDRLENRVTAGTGTELAVILLDIDHFKRVNDTHGHAMGDEVLRQVATVLSAVARPGDLVGRWGGEEFLLIAPGASPADADRLAEACRGAVEDSAVPPSDPVTASIGVASLRQDDTAWTLLSRADEALYEAKAHGRNRVRTHSRSCPAEVATGR